MRRPNRYPGNEESTHFLTLVNGSRIYVLRRRYIIIVVLLIEAVTYSPPSDKAGVLVFIIRGVCLYNAKLIAPPEWSCFTCDWYLGRKGNQPMKSEIGSRGRFLRRSRRSWVDVGVVVCLDPDSKEL